MTFSDPMDDIRASFFQECDDLLEALQDGLQQLFDGTDDTETIHVIFRAVHSIKGGAGAFGLDALVRLAHVFETALDGLRGGRLSTNPDLIQVLFRAADHLSDLVRASRDQSADQPSEDDQLIIELDALTAHPQKPEDDIAFTPTPLSLDLQTEPDSEVSNEEVSTFRIRFAPDAEMFENGNDVYPILGAMAALGACEVTCDTGNLPNLLHLVPGNMYLSWTIVLTTKAQKPEIASLFEFVEGVSTFTIDTVDTPNLELTSGSPPHVPPLADIDVPLPQNDPDGPVKTAMETSRPPPLSRPSPSSPTINPVIRVDIDRVERLVNLVGELVINHAMLSQSLHQSGLSPHSDAMNGLEEFQRLTRDIQDSVMMIRAQPVKSLFQRMSRIVRETSMAVGKEARLVTEGETTEIDKTVIECLADPLTHMIRNAVDHGLEDPETRQRLGKPPHGTIRLSATHRSGRVIIEVSDDGAGLNRPNIKQVAIDKGLIPPDASLTDSEIDNLLFLPGFSTVGSVSNLSGRGVGMDVVRTAIQSLGGRISITSTPSAGTTLIISLPLTLAVLDGMVVDVAGETLIVPLNMVAETMTITDDALEHISPDLDVVRIRDTYVRLCDLGRQLGYRDKKENYVDSIALIIALEDGSFQALVVDEIQDQRQVVIKGVDDSFFCAPGVVAATILGNGQIALIIDPSDVISPKATQ